MINNQNTLRMSNINIYEITSLVLSIMTGMAALVSLLIPTSQSSPKLNVNDQSIDSLYDELNIELKKAKRRYILNKFLYFILSFISIIGGIIVSTVYFNNSFNEQIGIIGFFILISSLLLLFFRPMEKYQQAKRDMAFLKMTERNYKCIDDIQEKNTFLREKLNEYDKRSISD